MFRFVILLLAFFGSLCAEILDKDKAFFMDLESANAGYIAKISFDESVYLYSDKLSLSANNQNITDLLDFNHEKNEHLDKSFEIFIPAPILQRLKKDEIELKIVFQGCSHSGFCYAPMSSIFSINLAKNEIKTKAQNVITTELSSDEQIANEFSSKSAWFVILSFFGYGLLLSFTPCVLPMIPIVSAIIALKAGIPNSGIPKNTSNSAFGAVLLYVLSLCVVNALLGLIAASIGKGIQGYLQTPAVLAASSAVFVLLALFCFGLARGAGLLDKFNTALNAQIERFSGTFGIVFMGALSALVVSPCVAAPLAGALLYIAASGDLLLGFFTLFALSFGMSVPLLALGAGVKFLPKPGAWMEKITKIFGFILLAMAIWLLSRLLSAQIIVLLYAILALFASIFLGLFSKKTAFAFRSLLFVIFGFSLFTLGALFYAKTNENSSIAQYFNSEQKGGLSQVKINNITELENFVKNAKNPVIIDFWANWCVNCKSFESELKNDILAQNLLLAFDIAVVDLSSLNDENSATLSRFGLFGPPAFLFFKDGKLTKKIVASQPLDEFRNILQEFIK